MRKKSTFRCLAIAAFVSSLGVTTAPSAGALELPPASDVVSQAAQDLSNAGIPVDPQAVDGAAAAVDSAQQAVQNAQEAVGSSVNSLSAPSLPAVAPQAAPEVPAQQLLPDVVPGVSSDLVNGIDSQFSSAVDAASQYAPTSPTVPSVPDVSDVTDAVTAQAPTLPNVTAPQAPTLPDALTTVTPTQNTDGEEYEPGRTETPPLVREYIDEQLQNAIDPSERAISSVSQLYSNLIKLRDGSIDSSEYNADKLLQQPNINRNLAEFEAQSAQFESQLASLGLEQYAQTGEDYRPILDGPNYHWKYDPFSKFMAQRFTAERVLHRVPGSWFDQPDTPLASIATERDGNSLYGPSTPVYVGDNQLCTIAATGYDKRGRKVAITAGHCGEPGAPVMSADSWRVGRSGTVVSTNKELDYSVIELDSNARVSRRYNNVTVSHVGGEAPGQWKRVCKTGVASGTTCGHVWTSDKNSNMSQVCAMAGDSGAPVMEGDRLVGMVSGGALPDHNLSCRTPWQGAAHMPTVSTNFEAVRQDIDAKDGVGSGFRLPDD